MRVEIGIPGPGIAVRERGPDQTGDLHLPHPARATAGEQHLLLHKPQRVGHRRVMSLLNLRGHLKGGDRPQR
jgi:hypothetical protein